jgi:hypothetical protein
MKVLIIVAVLILVAVLLLGGGMAFRSVVTDKFARAIAKAEGFYVSGSRPARNHNPGNMTVDLTGKAVGRDDSFVVYATDEDGWDNLRKQVWLMFSGGSSIYGPFMTIAEVASLYTTTQRTEWANNVAAALGVSTDTQLSQLGA